MRLARVWATRLLMSALFAAFFAAGPSLGQSGNLILDDVAGAAAAFSADKLRAGHDGPVVLIRRSSDDSLLSVGTIGDEFDALLYEAFVGDSAASVSALYDQSGNGADASQSVPDRQPLLVSEDNGSYVLAFGGLQGLGVPGLYDRISGASALTIFLVASWDGVSQTNAVNMFTAGRYRCAGRSGRHWYQYHHRPSPL